MPMALALAALAFLTISLSAPAADSPNILFVFTDDQAPWALGRAGAHANASTPNMDRLAGEGAYLPNSFTVTPVCSPSRASLMTSRYGSELGITDWIKPLERDFKDRPEDQPALDPEVASFPVAMKAAGYATGLIGKWHLGERAENHPTKQGYDSFMGFRAGGTTPDNPTLEKNGETKKFEGLTTDILTDEALAFLENHKDRKFLLSLHYRAPHTKWLPVAPEDWAPFEGLDPALPHPDYPGLDLTRAKTMTREYLASVRGVDRNLGRILEKLKTLGLEANTVVIFTSDHGYSMAHNGIWHKGNGHWLLRKEALPPATENIPSGQRPNLYDNSLKVPTIVRWPGVIKPGLVVKSAVQNIDWFPTFLEIAGASRPEGATLRGRSILPLLKGQMPSNWENEFFVQYSTQHQSRTHMRGWRSPKYKLIRDFLNPQRDEFYDLEKDPEEKVNEIGNAAYLGVIEEFDQKMLARMKEIGDTGVLR